MKPVSGLIAAFVLFAGVFAGGRSSRVEAFDGHVQRSVIRLQLKDFRRQMVELHHQGFDIAGVDLPAEQVDLVTNAVETRYLIDHGYQILATPFAQADLNIDSRYLTPETVESGLRQIHEAYPAFTELVSMGKSWEGRDIWALKISNPQVSSNTGKPVIWINGMHHAREVMTPEVPMDMARYLLSAYGSDAQATHWVDHDEIWLTPMINVDGNHKMWTEDNWWRKNSHGVDINRNYPYGWNSCNGSSSYPSAEDYRGPSAGSELETQVVVDFVRKIHPVFSLSLHSYAEVVLYPYGCLGQYTPTQEVIEKIGQRMASLLPSDGGFKRNYEAGTPPDLLYSVDGGDIDWLYHEAQVIPYVIEMNSSRQGFQPDYDTWRDVTVGKMRAAWMLLLERLDSSGIRGRIVSVSGEPITGATVEVFRPGQKVYSQTNRVTEAGIFHLVLNPGRYNVTYSAPGYVTQNLVVTVGESRLDSEVVMQPASVSAR